jgi:hypothetical protein
MPTVSFQSLWDNHPYPEYPCDQATFPNQCAIRMGVAIEKAGMDTGSFDTMYPNRRCYPSFGHNPKHILAAQELANWLATQTAVVGTPTKRKNVTSDDYKDKKGIVFIMDGWGATDHIDLWDGSDMKGGSPSYFALGKEVWFWELK